VTLESVRQEGDDEGGGEAEVEGGLDGMAVTIAMVLGALPSPPSTAALSAMLSTTSMLYGVEERVEEFVGGSPLLSSQHSHGDYRSTVRSP
jgi:hypothetical protein